MREKLNQITNSEMETKERITTIDFDIKVKTFNKDKGELIDAIAAGSKLTKADAGKSAEISEELIEVRIEPSENGQAPKLEIKSHSKLTKADSGRTE